ncbi:MAG: N-6 DNA methylase [Methylophaga sp.]|nr:N-6 DNA methylase [Methylophaga sp.]
MELQQYYTQNRYSEHMVNNLAIESPAHAFDLGLGNGGLLLATKRRWSKINLIGVDLDQENIYKAKLNSQIDAFEFDGFRPDLPEIINKKYGNIDLLVSNPPYFSCKLDTDIISILSEVGMMDCISKNCQSIPAELVFLAQNLRLLTEKGELGIILPAGLISGERWKGIREFLFSEYNVVKVIQLPTSSFKRTDAQAFILILTPKSTNSDLVLSHVDYSGEFKINLNDAIQRSDYIYYRHFSECRVNSKIIDDFSIFRGSLTHAKLKNDSSHYIHTSHLENYASELNLPKSPSSDGVNTMPGDIVIGRVGRRCLGRVALIKSGHVPVSDCIIIVRANSPSVRKQIWNKLKAENAKNTFYDLSLGVGAKYLTHNIVRNYIQFGS